MRLFIALDIDQQIRDRIAAFRDEMRRLAPDVRWVGPETFHLTLQFLGEVKQANPIQQALSAVHGQPTTLSFHGTGFFPNPRSPRVFWVGVRGDEALQRLVTDIAQALVPLGFKRDDGPFTPHLTLARSGSGRPRPVRGERPASGLQQVRAKLAEVPEHDFGTMTAHEFYLYESKLSPQGARYQKLASFDFTGHGATRA